MPRHYSSEQPPGDEVEIDPLTGRYPPNPGEDGGRLDHPGDGSVPPITGPEDRPEE